MNNEVVKTITKNAVVAAIYFVLTVAGSSLSFMAVQVRFAELLVLLCFFRKDYIYGLTIGCFLANLTSPILPWDLIFGTIATLLSCFLVSKMKNLFLATLIPVVVNGFIVGSEIFVFLENKAAFWPTVGLVALGEFVAVSVVGYLLFMFAKKSKSLHKAIGTNQNKEFKW